MSKIERMSITGVRSFAPDHGEAIFFYTPLTLIVGINGSGKTTIVECLKYITSGIQPPNSKVGGAFVHDPNLVGEKEVLAKVQLQFRNTQQARMVVSRSLAVTLKKNSRSLKTLEGSLLKHSNGEKSTVSSRVAELDEAIPANLGVSTAVLDNVIFCHQDESLWPMSEPSVLKKKFDEIFEAQKYTKAIENIKQIRKKHNEELGKYKILAQHAKEDRDRAEKARAKSQGLSDQIEKLRDDCNALQEKMDEAQARADMSWKNSENYSRILGRLEGLQIEAKAMQNNIHNLRERLQEVPESDEWLENNLAQFSATIAQYQEQRQDKKERWLEMKDELSTFQERMSSKLAERGRYEQDKEEYDRQLERRTVMVREAASQHQFRGFDDLSDASLVEEFLHKVKKTSKERNSLLERSREQADEEKQEALALINKLTERKAALQESKGITKGQIAQNEREASDYQRKANAIGVDEGSKAVVESRIEDTKARLQSAQRSAQISDVEEKLKTANAQISAYEDNLNRLNAELVQATRKAGEVARLSHVKQELREKQRSLDTLVNAHGQRLTQLIGHEWEPTTIERSYQSSLEEVIRAATEAEKLRDNLQRDLEQIQFKQKTLRDELSDKTTQASKDEKVVTKVIDTNIDQYDRIFEQASENVSRARDAAKGTEGILDYLNKCLENFNAARPACRTCHRAFKNPEDPSLVVAKKRVTGLIEKAGKQIDDAEVQQAEDAYKAVADAGIQLASWKKLTTHDIPYLEQSLAHLAEQRKDIVARLEEQDKTVQQKNTVRKDTEAVARNVASIAKHASDITSYQGQITDLTAEQSQNGTSRTLEDVQEEINSVNGAISNHKKTISNLTTEQSTTNNEIHQCELLLRDLKNELASITSQLERKADLLARVEEFKVLNQKQHNAIAKVDLDIQKLEPETLTAQARYDDLGQRWATKLNDLNQEAGQLTDTVKGLNLINDQVRSYLERGGDQRLVSVNREIKTLKQEMERTDESQVQLTREISKLEEALRDSEITERKYRDNLVYRRESRRVEELNEEIRELSSRNAEVDRDRFQEESKRATREYQLYSGEREGLLGQMKTKDGQLEDILKDFETDFADAPRRYKEAHIKVETTKAAVSDLQVYGSALDNAIMKFHGIKMEQVNEIISHLWQKTYKGSDIDNIMIRSDHEGGAAATTAARGRSYNYRVVMTKRNVEMDMRGRCSAGQKVLASIIIRLALADVFSQHCGLIALDEPTTNLDHENIISLAHSLHEIIQDRRKQANFQLIVITHDEEFLQAMNTGEFCEWYWRVARDRNANSVIEQQSILNVNKS